MIPAWLSHLAAQVGAGAVLGLFVVFLVCVSLANRKRKPAPKAVCQCGHPACEAFDLLNGKWPKYQRPYSEREAMRIAKAVRRGA